MSNLKELAVRNEKERRLAAWVLAANILVGSVNFIGELSNINRKETSPESASDNIDNLKVETPTLTPGHGSRDKVVYTGFTIGLEGYYSTKENMDKIAGWELYEKIGNTYKLLNGYDVETDIGETKTYVARAYVYSKENVKIYSGYSNEYKVDNSKVERPTLMPGYGFGSEDKGISNLVDVFDTVNKRNISGEYYVLELRKLCGAYCSADLQGKGLDVESIPKYLLLRGTSYEAMKHYGDEIEYEFANWDADITDCHTWTTDVSLMRSNNGRFNLILWKKDGDSTFLSLSFSNSYKFLRPISQLSELEISEVIEQYGNAQDVMSVMRNDNKNVSLNINDLNERYYVYDMTEAWNHMRIGQELGYNYCACFDVQKDNHDCALTSSSLGSKTPLPRYLLLKINDVKDGIYSFSNFNGDNGSFVIADVGGEEFSVVMNDITIPLTDTLRGEKASYCEVPDDAKAIVLHGNVNVFGNYLKPLSSLSKHEVERLCEAYGYNEDVISLVNDYWFGPLMGLVPVQHTEDPVMSNGLTASMNRDILIGVGIAGFKSDLLRSLRK